MIPAELVFLPLRTRKSKSFFGSSSNGLASGNSFDEAFVHGLAELIERDIRSFQNVRDSSLVVPLHGLPAQVELLTKAIEGAGLKLHLRFMPNEFGIPYFRATVVDPELENPLFINGGYGCHPLKEVAISRAITESLQSRLSFIHGGRDDLAERHREFEQLTDVEIRLKYQTNLQRIGLGSGTMQFSDIADPSPEVQTVGDAKHCLIRALKRRGFDRILTVQYTKEDDFLQVLRVVVPKLEFFTSRTMRVGKRLAAFTAKEANGLGVCRP